eukprot:4625968-Lingulodinium_polyedra.AAC.1
MAFACRRVVYTYLHWPTLACANERSPTLLHTARAQRSPLICTSSQRSEPSHARALVYAGLHW